MNTTQTGDITEHLFILYCLQHNIPICKPIGNNLPYDFVIDIEGKLLKIQVKTGYNNKSKDTFMFNTRSTSKNYTEVFQKSYDNLIDYFVVRYKLIPDKFLIIPVKEVTVGNMTIYYGDNPKRKNRLNKYDMDNFI